MNEKMEQNKGEKMLSNYSETPAVNIVHSMRGIGGITDTDVARVEELINKGLSSDTICRGFDEAKKYAAKDCISQAKAVKKALDGMGTDVDPNSIGKSQEEHLGRGNK